MPHYVKAATAYFNGSMAYSGQVTITGVTAGDTIIALGAVYTDVTGTIVCSDDKNAGNYSTAKLYYDSVNTSYTLFIFYKTNCAAGDTVVTLTPKASTSSGTWSAIEASGLTASPLDTSGQATMASYGDAFLAVSTDATIAQADEFGVATAVSSAGNAAWSSSPYTEIFDQPDSAIDAATGAYKEISSVAVESNTFTRTDRATSAIIATFKGASSSTPVNVSDVADDMNAL